MAVREALAKITAPKRVNKAQPVSVLLVVLPLS